MPSCRLSKEKVFLIEKDDLLPHATVVEEQFILHFVQQMAL